MNAEHTPHDKDKAPVPDVENFLDPATPPKYIEMNDGDGPHCVMNNEPPKMVPVPLSSLFEGLPPDDFLTYGTGPNVEGLLMRPRPEDQP